MRVIPFGIAAGISAVGGIASGLIGASASKSAAQTQANAANAATQAELGMYDQTVAREQPFVSAGTNALGSLQQLLGLGSGGGGQASSPLLQMLGFGGTGGTGAGNINPSTFQGSPGYQFQMQQGTNAVTNSAAANGGLGGNALRALMGVGQQTANQGWQQYLGNFGNAYQGLVGNVNNLVTGGQNAAGNLGTIGTTVGGQIGANTIGAGNALAAGQIGSASAMAGGINGVGQNAILAALLSNGGAGGGGPAGSNSSGYYLPSNISQLFNGGYLPGTSGTNMLGGAVSDASNPMTYG